MSVVRAVSDHDVHVMGSISGSRLHWHADEQRLAFRSMYTKQLIKLTSLIYIPCHIHIGGQDDDNDAESLELV